ncbi:MAG: hypothetical protein J6B16_00030 [Clostridia bacterium]|nr:hypothetical protein [Clostridia bacterium]
MNDKFYFGLALGMLGGAIIVANSVKAKRAVVSGQQMVEDKIEEVKDALDRKNTTKAKKN